MPVREAEVALVAVERHEALGEIVHVGELEGVEGPVVGAAGLVIGGSAEVHVGGVDHVAVEFRQRAVAQAALVLGEFGMAVKIAAHNAQFVAAEADAVRPHGLDVLGLGGVAGAARRVLRRRVSLERGWGGCGRKRQAPRDDAARAGAAGEFPAAAVGGPEQPQPPVSSRQTHARALARCAFRQQHRVGPPARFEAREEGLPVGRPAARLPAVAALEAHPEATPRVGVELRLAKAVRTGLERVGWGRARAASSSRPRRAPPCRCAGTRPEANRAAAG